MAGAQVNKQNGVVTYGPGKGTYVFKQNGVVLFGPGSGARVLKQNGVIVYGAKGGRVTYENLGIVIRIPKGGVVNYQNIGAVLRTPQGGVVTYHNIGIVFTTPFLIPRITKVAAYAAMVYVEQARVRKLSRLVTLAPSLNKAAVYMTNAWAVIQPPKSAVTKTVKYAVLFPQNKAFVFRSGAYVTLRPELFRVRKVTKYCLLYPVTISAKVWKLQKYAILQYIPPVRVFQLHGYGAIFPKPPTKVFATCAYVGLKEPVTYVRKIAKYAVFEIRRALVRKVLKYAILKPGAPDMYVRKVTGYVATKAPPPLRAYTVRKYAALAPPPPSFRLKKLLGYRAMQAPPPIKVQALKKYAAIKIPPPIRVFKVIGAVAMVPRPIAAIVFQAAGMVALAGNPPHVGKVNAYALLVPLGAIGERTKKIVAYALLTPAAPSAVTRYPVVNVN